MLSIQKINELINPILEENSITKYHIDIIKNPEITLQISIERDDGTMDLDTCEKVSSQISKILDLNDSEDTERYMLDVCSFGAEKQLYNADDISKHINDYVHIELKNPQNGFDCIEGYLTEFTDGILKIDYLLKGVKKHATIDLDNIKLIRLAVKF